MGKADVEHYTDLRPCEFAQLANLTGTVHRQFKHGDCMLLAQCHQGQGQTFQGIEVLLAAVHREAA